MIAVEERDGSAFQHHVRVRIAGEDAALFLRLCAEVARGAKVRCLLGARAVRPIEERHSLPAAHHRDEAVVVGPCVGANAVGQRVAVGIIGERAARD